MDRQDIIDHLLDHYETPRYHGTLAGADVVMPGGHPDCGDVVTIYLKVDTTGQFIEGLAFEGEGCSVSQAAASILAEMLQGAPLTRVDELEFTEMIDTLGRDVVKSRQRCATLALGTLKAAVAHYRKAQQREQALTDG
mgnify:CR=1 FL=1